MTDDATMPARVAALVERTKARRRRAQPEAALQRAIVAHLQTRPAPNIFWCHYPAGGGRTAIEGAIFKGLGVKSGVPDLLLCRASRLYALEIKTAGGRVTRVQRECHQALERAGAVVGIAVGIDEALRWLESNGLLRGHTQ